MKTAAGRKDSLFDEEDPAFHEEVYRNPSDVEKEDELEKAARGRLKSEMIDERAATAETTEERLDREFDASIAVPREPERKLEAYAPSQVFDATAAAKKKKPKPKDVLSEDDFEVVDFGRHKSEGGKK